MNPELLDRVLSCRDLPTLPTVAMRVLELTGSEQVSVKALAHEIQVDPGLAAKVLRTVNSSMYAVRTKCTSINQAIVMLGISAVKTLALSFTLVSAVRDARHDGLDMRAYWTRALHTAIAARAIANKARLPNPEECFLGGLLQDMGMIALHQALGRGYLTVVSEAGEDHRQLVKFELKALETHHADIGAMLAARWKLPEALVMPIKYHERPTAAPMEHTGVVRAVALGNVAAEVLASPEPAEPLRRFYDKCDLWFGLTNGQADEVLEQIERAVGDVAGLLSLPRGEPVDTHAILARARAQMEQINVAEVAGVGVGASGAPEDTDELTGLCNRMRFERALVTAFEQTKAGLGVLSLVMFDVDDQEGITARCGPEGWDATVVAVATRLERAIAPLGGIGARLGPGRFAAILPRVDRAAAVRIGERVRMEVGGQPLQLAAARAGSGSSVRVTVSVGLAALDQAMAARLQDHASALGIVEQAVKAARKAGSNAIRVYAPASAAA